MRDLRTLHDWESVRVRVSGWLETAAGCLVSVRAGLIPQVSHGANELHFSVALSLVAAEAPADEVAVVSVYAQLGEGKVELRSDVMGGKSEVVADGPSADIEIVEVERGPQEALASWMRDVEHFIVDEVPNILARMMKEPPFLQ